MEEILKLIEGYGLSLVLLLGSLYALYQFFFFSIKEVKVGFEKRHEALHKQMNEKRKVKYYFRVYKRQKKINCDC
jgi:hypothetical protein